MLYILIAILIVSIVLSLFFVVTALFNEFLPVWFCTHMKWHLSPERQSFDGCSFTGKCPRCGKEVKQDSQGNWFE